MLRIPPAKRLICFIVVNNKQHKTKIGDSSTILIKILILFFSDPGFYHGTPS